MITRGRPVQVYVDRLRAQFGSWYEFFPRSDRGARTSRPRRCGTAPSPRRGQGAGPRRGDGLRHRLPAADPSHRQANRKGRNNSVHAEPGDVGSPWAIGSAGRARRGAPGAGHDRRLRRLRGSGRRPAAWRSRWISRCSAHPTTRGSTEHPEWFTARPDGTIAYAENPPKKYQDIYPLNFDNDPAGIYAEVLRVVRFWIEHGVRIFRVDNPHTKPLNFWDWLIGGQGDRPGRAFPGRGVHPARDACTGWPGSASPSPTPTSPGAPSKAELHRVRPHERRALRRLRPNLFVNTPDILHESLQHGGPGMFAIRAALAATMAPTWGVYSGFELYEGEAVKPGSEEYLNSEKYELRPRDFAAAAATGNSLEPYITRLNEIRRAHPALQQLRNIAFHQVNNDQIICYSKTDPATGDTVLMVITLDPWNAQEGITALDLPALGLNWGEGFTVHDEITGGTWQWGQYNYVRLEPWHHVAHIFRIVR